MAFTELTQQDIVEKEFKSKIRGYDNDEVDEYLDTIIRDYKAYEDKISELNAENERLIKRLDKLSQEQKNQGKEDQQPTFNTSNFDILKRISNLERHVFGTKLNNED